MGDGSHIRAPSCLSQRCGLALTDCGHSLNKSLVLALLITFGLSSVHFCAKFEQMLTDTANDCDHLCICHSSPASRPALGSTLRLIDSRPPASRPALGSTLRLIDSRRGTLSTSVSVMTCEYSPQTFAINI